MDGCLKNPYSNVFNIRHRTWILSNLNHFSKYFSKNQLIQWMYISVFFFFPKSVTLSHLKKHLFVFDLYAFKKFYFSFLRWHLNTSHDNQLYTQNKIRYMYTKNLCKLKMKLDIYSISKQPKNLSKLYKWTN